jgi:hypothetical protein
VKKTVLLQNYPNHFNPETWIPNYHLLLLLLLILQLFISFGECGKALAIDGGKWYSYWQNQLAER